MKFTKRIATWLTAAVAAAAIVAAVAATAHALHIVPDSWELSDHYLYSDEQGDYHRCYRFENGNAPALACWLVDQPKIIPLP